MASITGGLGVNKDEGISRARYPLPTTTSPPRSYGNNTETFAYVWVVPVCVIGVTLLVILVCLVWFGFLGRRRTQRYRVDSSSQQEPQRFNDWAMQSAASSSEKTPKKNAKLLMTSCNPAFRAGQSNVDFKPRLGMISESPEDRMAALRATGKTVEPDHVFSPDDSLASVLAKAKIEMSTLSGVQIPFFPSPGYYPNASISHPNLMLSAQAPFSPYRLTWISPSPLDPRVIRSDPNIIESSYSTQNYSQPVSSVNTSDRTSYYSNNPSTSWTTKSPYHPNYNTPNGSDADSNPTSNIVINRTRSWGNTPNSASPQGSLNEKSKDLCINPPDQANSFVHVGSVRSRRSNNCMLSRNNAGQAPPMAVQPDLPLWDNAMPPPYPYECRIPPIPQNMYVRMVANDPRVLRTTENIACEQCQACMLSANNSMCPNVGSSNNSCNYAYGGPAPSYPFNMCTHVDSYESGPYSTSGSGPGSQSYIAAPYPNSQRHSTSIAEGSRHAHLHSQASLPEFSTAPISVTSSQMGLDKTNTTGNNTAGNTISTEDPTVSGMTSEATNSEISRNSTGMTNQLSMTAHSTRSAPAAIGGGTGNLMVSSQSDVWSYNKDDQSVSKSGDASSASKTISSSSSSSLSTGEDDHSNIATGVPSRFPSNNEISTAMSVSLSVSKYTPEVVNKSISEGNNAEIPDPGFTEEMEIKFPSQEVNDDQLTDIQKQDQDLYQPQQQPDSELNLLPEQASPTPSPAHINTDSDSHRYFTPRSTTSHGRSNSVHTTPESIPEFGPHLHLIHSSQPVLGDAQYWV